MRRMPTWTMCAVLALLALTPAVAQDDKVLEELKAIREGQEEILERLDALEKKVETPAKPTPAQPALPDVTGKVLDLGDNAVLGEADAPVTVVEWTDYQCPFCARHSRETLTEIKKEFIEPGRVRYVVMDLPLENIHPFALEAAQATHCAADQGKFWEMHDRLFANQRSLSPFSQHAEALGLDVAAFDACMEAGTHEDTVRRDTEVAREAGARSTPSFVIARTDPDDPTKVSGIAFLKGAHPYSSFRIQLEKALKTVE